MQFADYIISCSLQTNNRCLRYLAEFDAARFTVEDSLDTELHTVFTESLLARESRRLQSVWRIFTHSKSASWQQAGFSPELKRALKNHVDALQIAADALSDSASPRRLAMRLASIAVSDEDANAMVWIARQFTPDKPLSWEHLNQVYTADSTYWRDTQMLRQVTDEAIINGIVRSYRKAYRRSKALKGAKPDSSAADKWLGTNTAKFLCWVQSSAHQMELFRSGVSENDKTQHWYLDKLADSLRMRKGLFELARQIQQLQVQMSDRTQIEGGKINATKSRKQSKKFSKQQSVASTPIELAHAFTQGQIAKMDRRIARLLKPCFLLKPKKVYTQLELAGVALGLNQITVLDTRVGEQKDSLEGEESGN